MKALIFGSINSNFELVNKILDQHKDVDMCFSIGNLGLYSESSPIRFLLPKSRRDNATKSIELIRNNFYFNRMMYALYGSNDDPYIPSNELRIGNLVRFRSAVIELSANDLSIHKSRPIKIGLISGYNNNRRFPINNSRRLKMSREKRSNSLCRNDLDIIGNGDYELLLSHEAPYGIHKQDFGSKQLLDTLHNSQECKLLFYGHYQDINFNDVKNGQIKVIGLGNIEDSYCMINLYDLTYKWFVRNYNTFDGARYKEVNIN